jgi:hypothetical protein
MERGMSKPSLQVIRLPIKDIGPRALPFVIIVVNLN